MSTCCDSKVRGPPTPEPRATHPIAVGPQLRSRVPAIQTPRAPSSKAACHPGQLLSRVPAIQNRGPPAPEPRATHPTSKLRGPPAPKPRATHPNSAGPQLRSRVPPIPPGAFLFLLRRGPQQFLFGEKFSPSPSRKSWKCAREPDRMLSLDRSVGGKPGMLKGVSTVWKLTCAPHAGMTLKRRTIFDAGISSRRDRPLPNPTRHAFRQAVPILKRSVCGLSQ